jgi:hypothetical protein
MLRSFVVEIPSGDTEARDAIRHGSAIAFGLTPTVETVPIQKVPGPRRIDLGTVGSSIDIDSMRTECARVVPVLGRVESGLVIEHSRVVRLRVKGVDVRQLPWDACSSAVGGEDVLGLIDEASCGVPAEEIRDVEAVTYYWYAISGEGQSLAGVCVAASLVLAVWEEAEGHVRSGRLLAIRRVMLRNCVYKLSPIKQTQLRMTQHGEPQHCKMCCCTGGCEWSHGCESRWKKCLWV